MPVRWTPHIDFEVKTRSPGRWGTGWLIGSSLGVASAGEAADEAVGGVDVDRGDEFPVTEDGAFTEVHTHAGAEVDLGRPTHRAVGAAALDAQLAGAVLDAIDVVPGAELDLAVDPPADAVARQAHPAHVAVPTSQHEKDQGAGGRGEPRGDGEGSLRGGVEGGSDARA